MSANTITAIWRYGFITGVLAAVLAFIVWLFMPQPKKVEARPVPKIVTELKTEGATTSKRDSKRA